MKRMNPWAEIDAAKQAWDTERVELQAKLHELGVKKQIRLTEHGTIEVRLGYGVRATGRDAAALLAAIPEALAKLKIAKKEHRKRRESIRTARADADERRKRRMAELAGGAR